MLKTWISNGERVLANGVAVYGQNYSVYLMDGVLDIPPTMQELLRQAVAEDRSARKQGARKQSTEPAAAIFEAADPADTGEFSSIERLLDAAGWAHVLDMSGGGEDALAMHTVWAFSNHAFGEGLNYAERYYLLYGPAFAKDDDELYADAIADTRRFAAGCVSPGPVSIARLGAGTHKSKCSDWWPQKTLCCDDRGPEGASVGRVNDQPIGRADVIARNGIVHTVDKVALPAALAFTPQKMLVGLNATMFVRLLKDTGLGDYIDGTQPARKLTLLVPNNRAMEDAFGYDLGDEDDGLAKSPRDRQREWALYHVADGQSGVAELRRSPLLRTKLAADWTAGNPQVVKALVDRAQVSFNGADNILPEPLVVGNTTIYLLSSPMPTPPGLINALIQDLDLSFLAPVTGSFTSLGLVWAYLSLPGDSDARTDLSRLVKSHILNRPVYSDEVPLHTDSSAKTLMQSGAVPGALALALALDQARTQGGKYRSLLSVADANTLKISETDLLLRTGVAHVLGQGLILPANGPHFADLLERFNLTYVLEDPRIPADAAAAAATSIVENATTGHSSRSREIPDSDDGGSDGNGIVGYSLLVPSDKSWRENAAYRELVRRDHDELTVGDDENPWRNSTTGDIVHYLDMLVRLHIMPIIDTSASRPTHGVPESKLMLADRKTYPTLLGNVKLRVYEFANDRFSIQLDNLPFYQSPGGTPFVSFATVVRSGYARSGAVFELDTH
ncbi:hypothetical protein BX661DRAFT_183424 [Kickxella alabastrina]|uniref:uncharacterized protein n=1 Tax=Kickxella alabastrina TaxID=61397 RepID=UPI00221FD74F|nr:uncharacterized protein BX661DRAFT_183424 [Kickxella alabastrina]KAI7826760.1 hypothetical protein BX661DRAFT_183424 [Kickxella alabastrina]